MRVSPISNSYVKRQSFGVKMNKETLEGMEADCDWCMETRGLPMAFVRIGPKARLQAIKDFCPDDEIELVNNYRDGNGDARSAVLFKSKNHPEANRALCITYPGIYPHHRLEGISDYLYEMHMKYYNK